MTLREFIAEHCDDEGEVGCFIRATELTLNLTDCCDKEEIRKSAQLGYLIDSLFAADEED